MNYHIGQLRYFIAIPFSESTKVKIEEAMQGRLPIAYVNTSNLHLTLLFLGTITGGKIFEAQTIFSEAGSKNVKFLLEFDKITKFRNQIHLTIKPTKDLLALRADISNAFERKGFELEKRPFYPHVKLANLHMDKIMYPQRKVEYFPNDELQKLNFSVEKVCMFESILQSHYADHKIIMEVELK